MSRPAVLVIYNLLLPVALLLSLPGYLAKMFRRGNYGRGFGERFSIYRRDKRAALAALDRPLWIHAVSVGEVNIAKKLIVALRGAEPGLPVVLSTTTPTGFAIAERSDADVAIYNPVDFPPVAWRALRRIGPRALVLVEAEVWPNLVWLAGRRGLEVSLVNARMSPRSERRFRRFKAFTSPVFGMLTRVCVQEEEDLARWRSLGLDGAKLQHTGSVKFDPGGVAASAPAEVDRFRSLLEGHLGGIERRVLLAGSTHPGEEALVAEAYIELRRDFPDLYYLVAPRHVERRDEVLADLRAAGLRPALRTEIEGAHAAEAGAADCLVIDTTGELGTWYHLADLVVIGKSFLATGGQNPVEAIVADRPVVLGPHMENFAALERALQAAEGAVCVEEVGGLVEALRGVLADRAAGVAMATRALRVLAAHEGAARRTAEAILACKSSPAR